MNEKKINAIFGMEPMREGEYPIAFIVGHKIKDMEVTAIEYREANYGDHGIGWFDVFCGDVLHTSMQARAVSEIAYERRF